MPDFDFSTLPSQQQNSPPVAGSPQSEPQQESEFDFSRLPSQRSTGKLTRTSGKPDLDRLYEQAGADHGVDPNLLLEQGRIESINFAPNVIAGKLDSPKGARGVAQFMPDTARYYGLRVDSSGDDRSDPTKAIPAQARMMKDLLARHGGNVEAALAAYNSGSNLNSARALRNRQRIPETRIYVDKVTAQLSQARADYAASPTPENLSDVRELEVKAGNESTFQPGQVVEIPNRKTSRKSAPTIQVRARAGDTAAALAARYEVPLVDVRLARNQSAASGALTAPGTDEADFDFDSLPSQKQPIDVARPDVPPETLPVNPPESAQQVDDPVAQAAPYDEEQHGEIGAPEDIAAIRERQKIPVNMDTVSIAAVRLNQARSEAAAKHKADVRRHRAAQARQVANRVAERAKGMIDALKTDIQVGAKENLEKLTAGHPIAAEDFANRPGDLKPAPAFDFPGTGALRFKESERSAPGREVAAEIKGQQEQETLAREGDQNDFLKFRDTFTRVIGNARRSNANQTSDLSPLSSGEKDYEYYEGVGKAARPYAEVLTEIMREYGGAENVARTLRQLQTNPDPNLTPAQYVDQIQAKAQARLQDLRAQKAALGRPMPKLGFGDKVKDIFRNPLQILPFAGTGGEILSLLDLSASGQRIADGHARESDKIKVAQFRRAQGQDTSIAYDIANLLSGLPAFIGEMALTGGVYSGVKGVAQRGITFGLKKLLTKEGGELLEKELAKRGAYKFLVVAPAAVVGGVAQTVPAGLLRTIAGTQERMLPQLQMSPEDESGLKEITFTKSDDFLTALRDSALDQFVEVTSEHSGGSLAFIPVPARIKALKHAIARRFAKLLPSGTTGLQQILKRGGWHGVLGEMFEERLGEAGRAGLGIEPYRFFGVTPEEWMTPEGRSKALKQLIVEGTGLMVPGGLSTAVGVTRKAVARREIKKGLEEFFGNATKEGTLPEVVAAQLELTQTLLDKGVDLEGQPLTADRRAFLEEAEKLLTAKATKLHASNTPADNIPANQSPVPESPETLEAQAASAKDPDSPRVAVFHPVAAEAPKQPKGMARVKLDDGSVLDVNVQKIKEMGIPGLVGIRDFVVKNGIEPLIGKVAPVEDTSQGAALRTEDAEGNELSTSIVPTPADAEAQAEVDRQQFPQAANQEVLPAQEAAAARMTVPTEAPTGSEQVQRDMYGNAVAWAGGTPARKITVKGGDANVETPAQVATSPSQPPVGAESQAETAPATQRRGDATDKAQPIESKSAANEERSIQTETDASRRAKILDNQDGRGKAESGESRKGMFPDGDTALGASIPVAPNGSDDLPRQWQHADFGLVTQAENQAGAGNGRVRVTDEQGVEHIIQSANGRGEGNRLATPIRKRQGIRILPKGVSNVAQTEKAEAPTPARQETTAQTETGVDTGKDSKAEAGSKEVGVQGVAANGWKQFPVEQESLNIPRANMPQIKSQHRGAMVQFLKARGIAHNQEDVAPNTLKPSQAEFSPAKVQKARGFEGEQRSILVSSDNYVVDGHHQWLSSLDTPEKPIPIIRLDAPIQPLLLEVARFPSSGVDESTAANQTQGQKQAAQKAPPAAKPESAVAPEPISEASLSDADRTTQKKPELSGNRFQIALPLKMARMEDEAKRVRAVDNGAELAAKATSSRSHDVVLTNFEGAELIRRLTGDEESASFGSIFLEPELIPDVAADLRRAALDMGENGWSEEEARPLKDLADRIEKAASKAEDTVIITVEGSQAEGLPHESAHQGSYLGAAGRPIPERHDAARVAARLKLPASEKVGAYLSRVPGYRDLPDAWRDEEIFAHLSQPNYQKFGVTEEEALDYLTDWYDSYVQRNGVESLAKFRRQRVHVRRIIERVRARHHNSAQAARSDSGGGDRGLPSVRGEPGQDTGGTPGSDAPTASTAREGEVKERRTVLSAEAAGIIEKGVVTGPARYYTVKSRDVAQRTAQELIESIGLDAAITQAALPGEPSAERTALRMEVSELLGRQAIELRETSPEQSAAKMRQAIDLVSTYAPEYTEYGQAISQLAKWTKTSPEVIVSYAQRKLSQRDPSAKLTEEQAETLIVDAQALAEHEAKLAELRRKVASLQAQNRQLRDEKGSKRRKVGVRKVSRVGERVLRLLESEEVELMARVRSALGTGAALKMAREGEEADRAAQSVTLSPETLSDLARLGALRLQRGLPDARLTVTEWDEAMTSHFGPALKPYLPEIHAAAIRLRRQLLRDTRDQAAIERIRAEEGNENLPQEDLDYLLAEKESEQKQKREVRAEHYKRARQYDAEHKVSPLAERIVDKGADDGDLIGAALRFTQTGASRNQVVRELRREHRLNREEADTLALRGFKLYRESRKALDAERAALKGETDETREVVRQARSDAARAKRDLLRKLDEIERGRPGAKQRLNNIFRGIIVSALQTSVRNITTQVPRVGLEAATDALEVAFNKALRKAGLPVASDALPEGMSMLDAIKPFTFLVQRNKRAAEGILDEFPQQYEELFGSLGDYVLPSATKTGKAIDKVLRGAEKTVEAVNVMNRWQEFTTRRAVFMGTLYARMKAKNVDIFDLAKNDRAAEIPEADVRIAVLKALQTTFAQSPKRGTLTGEAVYALSNKVPAPVNPFTFSRFMYNAAKFTFEYSPAIFVRGTYRSVKNRKVESRDFVKGALGVMMLLVAAQMLDHFGGDDDEWWTLRIPGTDIITDARPYFPFASYLFLAHAAKRMIKGRKPFGDAGEAAEGVLGVSQFENPAWEVLKLIPGILSGDPRSIEKSAGFGQKFAGNTLGALLTPLKTAKDLISAFDREERIVRDFSDEPFMGGLKRNVPFASRGNKARVDPATGEPLEQRLPALRSLAGMRVLREDEIRPARSRAEEVAHNLFVESLPDVERTQAQKETSRVKARLKQVGRRGVNIEPRLQLYIKNGVLTVEQAGDIADAIKMTPLQEDVKKLSIKPPPGGGTSPVDQVYAVATPEEKKSLEAIIEAKRVNRVVDDAKEAEERANPPEVNKINRDRRAYEAEKERMRLQFRYGSNSTTSAAQERRP